MDGYTTSYESECKHCGASEETGAELFSVGDGTVECRDCLKVEAEKAAAA